MQAIIIAIFGAFLLSGAIASCSGDIPAGDLQSKATVPGKAQLRELQMVALAVKITPLTSDYYHSMDAVAVSNLANAVGAVVGLVPLIGPLGLFAAGGIDEAISSSRNRATAESLQRTQETSIIAHGIAEKVKQAVALSGLRCQYIGSTAEPTSATSAGFDGLLQIEVHEALLVGSADTPGQARIFISGSGTLSKLGSGEILWSRRQDVVSKESYEIDRLRKGQPPFSQAVDPSLGRFVRLLLRDIQYAS